MAVSPCAPELPSLVPANDIIHSSTLQPQSQQHFAHATEIAPQQQMQCDSRY